MKLTADQVRKVAKLANLPLSSEEEVKYSGQLSKILDYIEQLNKVDTSDIEPTYNVSGLSNVMAKDVLKKGSNTKVGFFVTKGVFDNE